jgi:hypothetical protein
MLGQKRTGGCVKIVFLQENNIVLDTEIDIISFKHLEAYFTVVWRISSDFIIHVK